VDVEEEGEGIRAAGPSEVAFQSHGVVPSLRIRALDTRITQAR
jgi:hypothetical protein